MAQGRRLALSSLARLAGVLASWTSAAGGERLPVGIFAFLGTILEAPSGRVFIRFLAPRALAEAEAGGFRRMVTEARGR